MSQLEEVEKVEEVSKLIKDASRKYKESTLLIDKAFEITLTIQFPEEDSRFLSRGANQHRKSLIRKLALFLEERSEDNSILQIEEIAKETNHALTFLKALEKEKEKCTKSA